MGRIFKTEKPDGAYTLTPSPETDVPNFPWCSGFVVLISILIGSQNICAKTREQKNTCTGKTEIKQCLREPLGNAPGYLWNINVVVCNLAGLDKNWTDFKKKRRTASKTSATEYDPCSQWIQCLELMLCQYQTYQTEPKAQNFLASEVRLCTGYCRQNRSRDDRYWWKDDLRDYRDHRIAITDQVWRRITVLFV